MVSLTDSEASRIIGILQAVVAESQKPVQRKNKIQNACDKVKSIIYKAQRRKR